MKNTKVKIFLIASIIMTTLITAKELGIHGEKYWCKGKNNLSSCRKIPGLKKGCEVRYILGNTIPPELRAMMHLIKGECVSRIWEPNDIALQNCAQIKNSAEALEYIQFFSSYWDVHNFVDKVVDVYNEADYPGCWGVCLSDKVWKKYRLHYPRVEKDIDGFIITRYVYGPIDKYNNKNQLIRTEYVVFKRVEEVTYDGYRWILDSSIVPMTHEETVVLDFPGYI